MLATVGLRIDHTPHLVALVGIVSVRQDPMGQPQRRLKVAARLVRGCRQRPQVLLEAIGPRDHRPQVGDAVRQAVHVCAVGGRLPQACCFGCRRGHPCRGLGARRLQQPLPGLGDQPQGGRHGDVGEDMGRIFEPQPIPDQALLPRLRDEWVKEGLMTIHAQAHPKWRQQTGHRQATRQRGGPERTERRH